MGGFPNSGGSVTVTGTATVVGNDTAQDADANPTDGLDTLGFPMVWNGATWDRIRASSPTAEPGNIGVLAAQIHFSDGTNIVRAKAVNGNSDGFSGTLIALLGSVYQNCFNGTTWDRFRNNQDVTVLASAAQTASFNGADQTNYNARGVNLVLDVTAQSGTAPTLDVKLQAKDIASGKYVDIPGAVFTQYLSATGTKMLQLYPGATVAANASVAAALNRIWRAVYTIGGAVPSFTFSLGASYIL